MRRAAALDATNRCVLLLLLLRLLVTAAAFATSPASFVASSGTLASSKILSFLVPTSVGSSSCRRLGRASPSMPVRRIPQQAPLGQVPSLLLSPPSSASSSGPVRTASDAAPKEFPELEQQRRLVLIGTFRKGKAFVRTCQPSSSSSLLRTSSASAVGQSIDRSFIHSPYFSIR
jgi:hypothetical protein